MIKIVYAADLFRRPIAAASMFRDRANQFHDRLGWEAVNLDDHGLEFDQYDEQNPIYVIIEDEAGEHCGSGRLMSTVGPTMASEHFAELFDGVALSSPLIWEVTRLCVSPRIAGTSVARRAPAALFYAGYDVALRSGAEFFVAVYFSKMQRVWRAIGAEPEVVGSMKTDEGEILGGLWEITAEGRDRLAARAGSIAEGGVDYFPSAKRFPFAPELKTVAPLKIAA